MYKKVRDSDCKNTPSFRKNISPRYTSFKKLQPEVLISLNLFDKSSSSSDLSTRNIILYIIGWFESSFPTKHADKIYL